MNVVESEAPTAASSNGRHMSREQTAWLVLLVAFAIFVLFAVTIPLVLNWYYHHASVAQMATVQGTSGTTLYARPNVRDWIDEGHAKEDVAEGGELRTDATSQAVLELFDRSTITIFPNTTVTLQEMRRPRFNGSTEPDRIVIGLDSGSIRVRIPPPSGRTLHFELRTPQAPAPHGGILLYPGSYVIEMSNQRTHVAVRSGQARVTGQTGQPVGLEASERAEIPLGAAAIGPLPGKRNLLTNSDFRNPESAEPISRGPLVEGWIATSNQGDDGGEIDGTAEVVMVGATRALHFERRNSLNNHGETGVEQAVNKVVDDYQSLALSFDVMIVEQSLAGGGEKSTEFPLMVRVDYKDANGYPQHWTQGFYCQNVTGYNVLQGTRIPCNTPFRFTADLKEVLASPLSIDRVRLYASGWDWEVYVSEVELIAE